MSSSIESELRSAAEEVIAAAAEKYGVTYVPTRIPQEWRAEHRKVCVDKAMKALLFLACSDHEQIADAIEAARHDAIADVIANPPASFARHTANDFEGTEK